MYDLRNSVQLIILVFGIMIRFDALILLYLKRKEVALPEGMLLSLLSPVLAMLLFSLRSNKGWRGVVKGPPTYLTLTVVALLFGSQVAAAVMTVCVLILLPGSPGPVRLPGLGGPVIPARTLSMMLSLYCAIFLSALAVFLGRAEIKGYMSGRRSVSTTLIGTAGMLLAQGVFALIFYGMNDVQGLPTPTYPFMIRGSSDLIFLMVPIAILVPMLEEIAFRGAIHGSISRVLGPVPTVIITASIFSVSHLDPVSIVPLLIMGLVLGWARHRSGSILPGIVIHAINNVIALIFLS